jgi:KipI family sensor histidine kinase inhibitor
MGDEKTAVRILPLGDAALTVEFGRVIEAATQARVTALAAAIDAARQAGDPLLSVIVDVVPTFRSLTLHLARPGGEPGLADRLARMAAAVDGVETAGRHWRLPASFDPTFAPDLDDLAVRAGLDRAAAVALLLGARFEVGMIGFMPGFPYMTGVPARLSAPRLSSPRTAVPARSIAVTGEMCAVYPWQSPGGWRLVGSTPVDLFDPTDREPSLLAAGDTVEWAAVSADAYRAIAADLAAGRVRRRDFRIERVAA